MKVARMTRLGELHAGTVAPFLPHRLWLHACPWASAPSPPTQLLLSNLRSSVTHHCSKFPYQSSAANIGWLRWASATAALWGRAPQLPRHWQLHAPQRLALVRITAV
jgi:hypothetical protein